MGLAPILVEQIFDIIRRSTRRARRSCWSSRTRSMALAIANRGYILQTGEIVLSGRRRGARQEPGRPRGPTSGATDPAAHERARRPRRWTVRRVSGRRAGRVEGGHPVIVPIASPRRRSSSRGRPGRSPGGRSRPRPRPPRSTAAADHAATPPATLVPVDRTTPPARPTMRVRRRAWRVFALGGADLVRRRRVDRDVAGSSASTRSPGRADRPSASALGWSGPLETASGPADGIDRRSSRSSRTGSPVDRLPPDRRRRQRSAQPADAPARRLRGSTPPARRADRRAWPRHPAASASHDPGRRLPSARTAPAGTGSSLAGRSAIDRSRSSGVGPSRPAPGGPRDRGDPAPAIAGSSPARGRRMDLGLTRRARARRRRQRRPRRRDRRGRCAPRARTVGLTARPSDRLEAAAARLGALAVPADLVDAGRSGRRGRRGGRGVRRPRPAGRQLRRTAARPVRGPRRGGLADRHRRHAVERRSASCAPPCRTCARAATRRSWSSCRARRASRSRA